MKSFRFQHNLKQINFNAVAMPTFNYFTIFLKRVLQHTFIGIIRESWKNTFLLVMTGNHLKIVMYAQFSL